MLTTEGAFLTCNEDIDLHATPRFFAGILPNFLQVHCNHQARDSEALSVVASPKHGHTELSGRNMLPIQRRHRGCSFQSIWVSYHDSVSSIPECYRRAGSRDKGGGRLAKNLDLRLAF